MQGCGRHGFTARHRYVHGQKGHIRVAANTNPAPVPDELGYTETVSATPASATMVVAVTPTSTPPSTVDPIAASTAAPASAPTLAPVATLGVRGAMSKGGRWGLYNMLAIARRQIVNRRAHELTFL